MIERTNRAPASVETLGKGLADAPVIAPVAAVAENGVIGNAGRLPWHLPADLKHFKTVTMGKPMLMGRKTFDSIGRALPGRRSLVLTRDPAFTAPDITVVRSLAEAIEAAKGDEELTVIGGAEIYRLTLPFAGRVYLTRVHAALPGDTRFPAWDSSGWRSVSRAVHPGDEKNAHAMTFMVLEAPELARH